VESAKRRFTAVVPEDAGEVRSEVSGPADEMNLVRQAQAGDDRAFARLLAPYMRKAYHMALKITRNREDAEDAAQQCFLNAYSHIGQFNGQSRFSSWLLRIAINEALIRVRKRRSEDHHLSYESNVAEEPSQLQLLRASDASHPEFLYSKSESKRALREAIDGLGSTSRVVVWLLGLQERQTKEAANILKLSQSAVKTRFSRACQQLRECLAERI
jgi:RNA polymerase sigma-70 factor (ECF subfamily)